MPCRKRAASAASTACGTAGARPGEPGASITPRGRRRRVSQLHGGREARRTRGPNHAQLRQGLPEEEAVDEVLQVRGDGGAQTGGERVVEAKPRVLPKSQSTVVPASELAMVQDNTHQVVAHRGEGSPMPQGGQLQAPPWNREGLVQLPRAQRTDLKAVYLKPKAGRHTEIGDPLRGTDVPAAGAVPGGERVHLRQLVTQSPIPPVPMRPPLRGQGYAPDEGAVDGLSREAAAFGPQAATGEKLLGDGEEALEGREGSQVMPTLKQVLLERASEGRLSASKLPPEGSHVQRGGVVREEVLDGLNKEQEEGVAACPGPRKALGGHGGEALHQGGEVASVAHVASTSWERNAALGG